MSYHFLSGQIVLLKIYHLVSQLFHPSLVKEVTAVPYVEVAQTCLLPSGQGYLLSTCS